MKYIWICLLLVLLSGCERDFDSLNLNPNAPESVAPQFLLSNVLWEAANQHAIIGWKAGNLLAQHTSNLEFLPVDRYDLGTQSEYWNHCYHLLNDLAEMEAAAPDHSAYRGVAMILRAWLFAQLTDLWGDVPVFEAIKGKEEGNFTPAYDSQQAIYTAENGILDLLEKGAALLGTSKDLLAGDILYGGELNKWVRFANSLRVRYLMRISNRVEVGPQLQALVDAGQLMSSNEDNALIPYLANAPNQWFMFSEREGRYTDLRMSKTIEEVLLPLEDPRLPVWFKPTQASLAVGAPAFKGLPNGLSRDSQNAFNLADISLLGAIFRDVPDGVNACLMRYDELQFALAEASERGWIHGDAKAYYENGIQANMAYYGLAGSQGYLHREAVALNGRQNLEKIMTQKWLSLLLVGHEAWFNVRRTGLPVLPIPKDNLNNDRFPRRYRYPETEQAANHEQYQQAVARLGEDAYHIGGWWDG